MHPTFASLSLAHLRTLDCLLQLKNLSHAAERLGTSQSALSRQLAHLRDAFDDPLLVRQGRGYVLSEHAESLVEPLRQVLEELAAIESGAQDFEEGEEEGSTLFITDTTDLDAVQKSLPEHGFTVTSAKIGYTPKNPISAASLSAEALAEVEAFLEAIDNHDDVQNVYVGLSG